MNHDTHLATADLERALAAIGSDWRLRGADAVEAGHHAVYRLSVATPDGDRTCYLKATPPGKAPTVDTEARLLAVLGDHTGIPVPAVRGVVDEHGDLPAPFVLTEAMPGAAVSRTELPAVESAFLRGIARQVGRHLAELHGLDAVESYGFLTHGGPTLRGEAPAGDLDSIAVADPIPDWRVRCHDWADGTLERVGDTRFADVVPDADPVLRDRIDGLDGSFEPALARIDQALENGLFADGDLTAMLDWEFTIAATPAYDVEAVVWSLAGGPYLFAPEVPDRRELVREAVLAGYSERGSGDVTAQLRANGDCYRLLAVLRSMVHLRDWFDLFDLDGVDAAAEAVRADLARLL